MIQNYYVEQVYSIEHSIRNSLQKSFPISFNPYFTSSKNYNLQDTCLWYYNVSLGDQKSQYGSSNLIIYI